MSGSPCFSNNLTSASKLEGGEINSSATSTTGSLTRSADWPLPWITLNACGVISLVVLLFKVIFGVCEVSLSGEAEATEDAVV